jgi:hypothetical protein
MLKVRRTSSKIGPRNIKYNVSGIEIGEKIIKQAGANCGGQKYEGHLQLIKVRKRKR